MHDECFCHASIPSFEFPFLDRSTLTLPEFTIQAEGSEIRLVVYWRVDHAVTFMTRYEANRVYRMFYCIDGGSFALLSVCLGSLRIYGAFRELYTLVFVPHTSEPMIATMICLA